MFISFERARNTEKLKVWKSFKFSEWSIVIMMSLMEMFSWIQVEFVQFRRFFATFHLSEFVWVFFYDSGLYLAYWLRVYCFFIVRVCFWMQRLIFLCMKWQWNELNQVISKIQSKMMTRIQPIVWKLDHWKSCSEMTQVTFTICMPSSSVSVKLKIFKFSTPFFSQPPFTQSRGQPLS